MGKIHKNDNFQKNNSINKDYHYIFSLGINKSQSQSQSVILNNSKHSIKDSLLTNLNISNQKEIKSNEIINIIKLNINKIVIKTKNPFNKAAQKALSYRDKKIFLDNHNCYKNVNKIKGIKQTNGRIIRIINKNKINQKRRIKIDKNNSIYLFGMLFLFIIIIFFIENNF